MSDTLSAWKEKNQSISKEISTVEIFEKEYPELSSEFKKITEEMYILFSSKHLDYGLNNIALGGDILNSDDDKKF